MAGRVTIQLVMCVVMSNPPTCATTQLAMAFTNIAAHFATVRGSNQFATAVVIHERGHSWDDSACDDHRDSNTQPVVGRFNWRRPAGEAIQLVSIIVKS